MTKAEELQAFRLACVEAVAKDLNDGNENYEIGMSRNSWHYGREYDDGSSTILSDAHAEAIVERHFEDEFKRLAKECGATVLILFDDDTPGGYPFRLCIRFRHRPSIERLDMSMRGLILAGLQALKKWRNQNDRTCTND